MSPIFGLSSRLAVARLRGARGGAMLDVLAVIAFTVSAFLTLTVAGGTWMFVHRWLHPSQQLTGYLSPAVNYDAAIRDAFLQLYVVLAMIACALLVVPVLNLGAAAARLGARGRAQRLASLRLVGMSARQIVAMSTIETLVQAAVGTVLGLFLWLASLFAWRPVSFQGQHIAISELVLPWWAILAVIASLFGLAALSTSLGLQQVRISPLGVAAQETPRALHRWRVAAFVGAIIAFAIFGQLFTPNSTNADVLVYSIVVAMILMVVGAVNLIGPWILQQLARPGSITGSVPRLVATRRIIDDPRGAWRNVSGVALLGMVASFVAMLPSDPESLGSGSAANVLLFDDLRTGVIITLAVGLVVAATSTLINQGALVLDRADESVAMDRAGFPRTVLARIRRHHVMIPLIMTLAVSVGVGLLLASPFMGELQLGFSGVALMLATIIAGLLLTLAAAEACRPLQHKVLEDIGRRND